MKQKRPYRPLLQSTREAVYETSTKGRSSKQSLARISESVRTLLGYKPAEFEKDGDLWISIVHPDDQKKVAALWRGVLRSGRGKVLEYRVKPKKRRDYIWVEDSAIPLRDTSGKKIGVAGSVIDVTERKRLEYALDESETHLKEILDDAVIGMYRTTPDGRVLMVNKALLKMLGYSSLDKFSPKNLNEKGYQPGYPRKDFRRLIEKEGSVVGFEAVWTGKNGKTIYARENAHVVRDGKGRVKYYEGTVEDISDRKSAEERTIRLNRVLRMVSSVGQLMIHESNQKTLLARACEAIVEEGGYRMAWIGLRNEKDTRVAPLASGGKGTDYLRKVLLQDEARWGNDGPEGKAVASQAPSVCNNVDEDPSFEPWRDVTVRRGFHSMGCFPMRVRGTVVGLLGVYSETRDRFGLGENHLLMELADNIGFALWAIEARVQQAAADEVIRDREFWLKESQRVARVGSYIYEVGSGTWSCSAALDGLLGIDGAYERNFRSWLNLIHHDDRPSVLSAIRRFTTKQKQFSSEFRIVRSADKEVRWMWGTGEVLRDAKGRIVRLFGTVQDITDRRLAEEALVQSEKLFHTSFENSSTGIALLDLDGKFRKVNAKFSEMIGYAREEISEYKCRDLASPDDAEVIDRVFADTFNGLPGGGIVEERCVRKDGRIIWVEFSVSMVRNQNGQPDFLIANFNDISERKRAEEAFRNEHILLRTLIDNLPNSIYVKDVKYRKTLANHANVEHTGKTTESEVLGKTDFDLYSRELAEKYHTDDQKVIRDGKAILVTEEYSIGRDGKRRWQLTSKIPLRDKSGTIIGLIGIGTDITERKQSEENARRERALLKALFDHLPASIWVKDKNFRRTAVNKAHVARTALFSGRQGLSEEDFIGKTDFDIYDRAKAEAYFLEDQTVIRDGKVILDREELVVDSKGEKHWQLVSKVPLAGENGEIAGLIGIVTEITKQKEAEEARERERVLLRTLIDNLPNAIFVKDMELRKLVVNPAHVRRVALSTGKNLTSESQLLGKTDLEIYPYHQAHEFAAEDSKLLKDGTPVLNREEYSVDPDGEERWELVSKIPLRDESGAIIGMVGITSDITEQKQVEEALRSERILLRTILDHIPNAIFVKDKDYRKILVNPAHVERMSEHIGPHTDAELLGKTDFEICPPHLAEDYFREDQRVLQDGATMVNRPMSHIDMNGKRHWELISKIPMRNEKGDIVGLVGVSTDITALREIEERLSESESKFRLLAENARDVVFRYGLVPAKHYEYISPSATEVVGYTPEEYYSDPDLIVKLIHPEDRVTLEDLIDRIRRSEDPITLRWIRKDQTVIWVEILCRVVSGDKNELVAIEGIVRDITERKKSEDALRRSEETLARITGAISDIIYSVNGTTGEFEYLSPAFEKTLGYSPADIGRMGGRWSFLLSVIEGDKLGDLDPVTNDLQKHPVASIPVWERWWKCKDGTRRFIEDYSVPIYDGDRLVRIDGVLRDITQRKLAEDEVEKERILLRTLIDNFPYAIYVKDRNYRKVIANAVDVQYLAGLSSEEEIIGKTDFDIYPKETAERFFANDQRVIVNGETIIGEEEAVIDARGQEHWLMTTKVPLRDKENNITGLVGVGIDVTERRAINEALRRSEAELRALFESMNDVILVIDNEGRYLKIAPTDPSLLFGPAEELAGKTVFDVLPEEKAALFLEVIHDVLRDRKTHTVEYALEIGGEERWRAASVSPMTEDSVIWVARDVTERKTMENEIADSEKKYRELVENALVGVFKINLSGTIVYANKAMADMLEFETPQDMMSVSLSSLYINVGDMADLVDELRAFGKTDKNKEVELVTKSGKVRNVLISASLDRDVISGMAKDITEIRTLEREFIQTQKLEGLGNIAAGIAHDFNNILGVILGYSDLLEQSDYEEGKFERGMQAITKSAERGKSLVRQLLTFARKTDVTFESVVLNDEVVEIQKLVEETFPKTIEVRTNLQKELPPVLADVTQIHQVLLNLCVNARDAMPEGGTLLLSTAVVTRSILAAVHPEALGDRYVEVQVRDNGTGMDAWTLQRIFEPFFTTKGIGKGTGLGLSVVYGIIESHRGYIDVVSEPGGGTTFKIYIPVLDHAIDDSAFGKNAADNEQGRTATILVIEDEEMLRELLRSLLTSKGHKVVLAKDGEDGVNAYSQSPGAIDLVISDLGLPKLNGEEVVKRIKKIGGRARLAIASGFISPDVKAKLEKEGVVDFIQKPYRTAEVIKVVDRILRDDME